METDRDATIYRETQRDRCMSVWVGAMWQSMCERWAMRRSRERLTASGMIFLHAVSRLAFPLAYPQLGRQLAPGPNSMDLAICRCTRACVGAAGRENPTGGSAAVGRVGVAEQLTSRHPFVSLALLSIFPCVLQRGLPFGWEAAVERQNGLLYYLEYENAPLLCRNLHTLARPG